MYISVRPYDQNQKKRWKKTEKILAGIVSKPGENT